MIDTRSGTTCGVSAATLPLKRGAHLPRPVKLILRNHQSPGDVLMLTAAVRDLHRSHPGAFMTAIDSSCPEMWENNPFVTPHTILGTPDRILDCQYPLVHESNRRPYHFIHGFTQDLERHLEVRIPAGPFKGDVHLSQRELDLPSPAEAAGHTGPYWVVVAGGKLDFTAKWWDPDSVQAVVDHFAGRIRFVQCGSATDWHVRLRGAVDLVGRTNIRDLIRLLYHADGVLCPVTFAMHLAAAVPPKPGGPPLKACVVVAGGREPAHWEMYPGHQFLHTVGALQCCAGGGCWKSRCQPVGDGDASDADLCVTPVTTAAGIQIGKCMAMITPRSVIDAINLYYDGGILTHSPTTTPVSATPTVADQDFGQIRSRLAGVHARPNDDAIRVAARRGVAVTIGVGSYRKMASLAAREITAQTGLDTVVLGDDIFAASGLEHPDFLKFRLFDLVRADHIFFFDADMVCLEPWDPAEFFGLAEITCVRDRLRTDVFNEAAEWRVAPEDYFNAGFFIVAREHHAECLRLAERLRFRRPTSYFAQSPLNAARVELGVRLRMLDRRYNWLGFGESSLSHDVPVVMAHKLAPHRHDLNVAYFEGSHELSQPRLALNRATTQRIAGKTFNITDSGACHALHLRADGTVLPPTGPDGEGYWFVHDIKGRPRLALASETRVEREFVEVFGGTWVEAPIVAGSARLVDASTPPGLTLNRGNARDVADAWMRTAPPYPDSRFRGRGIVICGGGERYFPSAWVCVRMLRHLNCKLPIELWQLTESELSVRQRHLVEALGVTCVDAGERRMGHPLRMLNGWELKPYAITHSSFDEVLLLDADNVPVRDPTFLFDTPEYVGAGAVFWPDYGRLGPNHEIWRICQVPHRDEPEFESGQVLVNKRRCWKALQLTIHLNDHSDFYYDFIYGDKETFHMAWRMLGLEYAMVPWDLVPLQGLTMCQHDFQGRRLFQHRHGAKWSLTLENRRIVDFEMEDMCLEFLRELALAGPSARPERPARQPEGTGIMA